MSRGTTVTNLLSFLKAEIGDFSGTNTNRDAELTVLLSNMQKKLLAEHRWPFLVREWDVTVPAGQQFTTLPTTTAGDPEVETVAINLDELPTVQVLYNTIYQPVIYGISEEEYNTFNFALNAVTSDPIQRWRLATNPNEANAANKFEVWPVPTSGQTMRFTGERALQALATGTDTADLDDIMLVLFVAADKLAAAGRKDAPLKLQMAQRRLQWLKQGYTMKTKTRTLDGMGDAAFKRDRKLTGMRIMVH